MNLIKVFIGFRNFTTLVQRLLLLILKKSFEFFKNFVMIGTKILIGDKSLGILKFLNYYLKLAYIMRIKKICCFKEKSLLFEKDLSLFIMRDAF